MKPRKKEIESVKPGSSCAESYPCQHSLTIKYKDGTTEETWANGREIAEKYLNYLDANDKGHFKGYAKSGLFSNKPAVIQSEYESYLNFRKQL